MERAKELNRYYRFQQVVIPVFDLSSQKEIKKSNLTTQFNEANTVAILYRKKWWRMKSFIFFYELLCNIAIVLVVRGGLYLENSV